MKMVINLSLTEREVPDLREKVGWDRRDDEYPALLERCNFWAGAKHNGTLIAFGYICGMGLQHGYMEDIIVHPDYRGEGIGRLLVSTLIQEAERFGLEIVTVTFDGEHAGFYEECGFTKSGGGVWRKREQDG